MRALVIGNSDGIGLSLSERLLHEGHQVEGISRRASALSHPAYRHTVCDVSSADYESVLAELLRTAGPFDVCIYCAGIGEPLDLARMAAEAQVFRVNLLGLVRTCSLVLPAMVSAGRGQLVGLSSIGDETLSAYAPAYAASKAGMSSYLAGLALALRPRGVTVSNVRLGFVDTKMAKGPVRPLMMSVEQAVNVVMRCMSRKSARVTAPWRMDWLVRALRWLSLARLALR